MATEDESVAVEQLNENLAFTKTEMETNDAIPCLRGNMFEGQSFVKYGTDAAGANETHKFMTVLNQYMHNGGSLRPPEDLQRDINKIFTVVTLRQILSKLTLNVHLNSDDGRYHAE